MKETETEDNHNPDQREDGLKQIFSQLQTLTQLLDSSIHYSYCLKSFLIRLMTTLIVVLYILPFLCWQISSSTIQHLWGKAKNNHHDETMKIYKWLQESQLHFDSWFLAIKSSKNVNNLHSQERACCNQFVEIWQQTCCQQETHNRLVMDFTSLINVCYQVVSASRLH